MRIGRIGFAVGQASLSAALYWHDALAEHLFGHASPRTTLVYVAFVFVAGSWFLATLRCHDFNETVWNNFWTEQVPFIGQILALAELLTRPGTTVRNSYGAPPFF